MAPQAEGFCAGRRCELSAIGGQFRMVFVEFPNFTKRVGELLNDETYRRLQAALIANPELATSSEARAGSARCGGRRKAAASAVACG